jgi:hypothetical protein
MNAAAIATEEVALPVDSSRRERRWMALLAAASILVAAAFTWYSRYATNADGLSYLDMATNALHGDLRSLLIPNWSPLYPSLIAVVLAVFRPSPAWEVPAIHFLDWGVFVVATFCFQFFLRKWFRLRGVEGQGRGFLIRAVFAHCVFTGTGLMMARILSPDLCVASCVYLAAGFCCRFLLPGAGRRQYVLFGCALAMGYYAKSPLLPLGVALMTLLSFALPDRHGRRRLALAAAVFLLGVAPYVATLSLRQGHPTFGEAGKLNYAWYVNRVPYPWIGRTAGAGLPVHPPRLLREHPLLFEFSQPIAGTFPLWYNPTYWNEGLRTRIDFRQVLANTGRQLLLYLRWFLLAAPMWAGIVALRLAGRKRRGGTPARPDAWFLLAWPLVAMGMYLVHVDFRYIAPFLALLWLFLFENACPGVDPRFRTAVLAAAGGFMLLPPLKTLLRTAPPDFLEAARGLEGIGLRRGDRLAVAGDLHDGFYARAAGVRIVDQVCDTHEFFTLEFSESVPRCRPAFLNRMSAAELSALWRDLRTTGARAVIVRGKPPASGDTGWRVLGNSGYAARMLK